MRPRDNTEWHPIAGFDGYEVSNTGLVRSVDRIVRPNLRPFMKRGQLLKQLELKPPATRVYVHCIRNDGKDVNLGVGRTVLEGFIGPCPDGMECCHNDGDKWNNNLSNLRWDSRSENQHDSVRHGTHACATRTQCPAGHPYDEENTRIRPCGRRICRACHRRISRQSRLRNAGKAVAGIAAAIILAATGVGWGIGEAKADEPGCQSQFWLMIGANTRTLCDSPILADGSWMRSREFWTPAHQVPLRTYCSGGLYYSSCSTSGGYFQPATSKGVEVYRVTADTVLPDEPGHIAGAPGYVA